MHHDVDVFLLLSTLTDFSYSLGLVLVACELCQRNSQAYEACSEMVDQMDWLGADY